MKKYKLIKLTEEQFIQFEQILGEIPTKWGNPLVNLYVPNTTTTEEEQDGGGSPKPPKPPKPPVEE